MKSILSVLVLTGFVLGFSSCAENQTRIGEGAGIGGILGAAAGGIIGHQSGHGVEGALIGGAVGATSGAVVGSQINKQKSYDPRTPDSASPVTIEKVVSWTMQGESSDDIIARIKSSGASFSLTADDINYLKKQGVSQRVIEAMQAAK